MLWYFDWSGGLFSADPRSDANAHLIQEAQAGDPALEKMAGGAGSDIGKGGMLTKVLAAKVAAQSGADTVIASGLEDNVLVRLAKGEPIGSQLSAKKWASQNKSELKVVVKE